MLDPVALCLVLLPVREPEPPEEESEPMQKIRKWRSDERKKLIESMNELMVMAKRMAMSRYTRSAQRAKWTRLAGQLLWYKDQVLRAMTWEALEQDVKQGLRDQAEDRKRLEKMQFKPSYPVIQPVSPAPFQPTIVKKKQDGDEGNQDSVYSDDSSKEPVA
jgi:hypothetical protein